jgi:hypothetical protein
MTNFSIELEGVLFEFRTMNVNKLQLFQVYIQFDGRKVRFHMQRKGDEGFYITDPDKVPEQYRHLEKELNAAIFTAHPKHEKAG